MRSVHRQAVRTGRSKQATGVLNHMNEVNRDVPLVMNVAQVSAALQLSENSVRKAIHEGTIFALRIGRKFLVPRTELERLLEPGKAREEAGQANQQKIGVEGCRPHRGGLGTPAVPSTNDGVSGDGIDSYKK
jgi:excisionase family DNA binding protein